MKNIEDIGFIISKEQYLKNEDVIVSRCFLDINNIVYLNLMGIETIHFSESDYLKSNLYKEGNIILIPFYYYKRLGGYCLYPFQILKIESDKTYLFSKNVLFTASAYDSHPENLFEDFNKEIKENKTNTFIDKKIPIRSSYEYSYIRYLLNSQAFYNRFPKSIQEKITFHDIYSKQKKLKDRFWLISTQELGEAINNLTKKHLKNQNIVQDFPTEDIYYSNIFYDLESTHKNYFYLTSYLNMDDFKKRKIKLFKSHDYILNTKYQVFLTRTFNQSNLALNVEPLTFANYKVFPMFFESEFVSRSICPAFYLNN